MRVNATDLQNAFGKYLSLTEKEDIVIVKNGKSVAKLVHYTEPDYLLLHEEAREYNSPRRISYEEYLNLVNSSEQRYELIDGEIYLMASPSFNHQIVVNEIAGRFYNYFKGKSCRSLTAPLDVRLFGFATKFEEDPNVVQPDVIVICDTDKVGETNKYEGVPTMVAEVLSPSTKGKDMVIKLNLYMKSGILEYWVVDLENKSIFQYSFSGERDIASLNIIKEGDTVKSTVFESLEVSVSDLFAEIATPR
jgi:prevent-host-death family protein